MSDDALNAQEIARYSRHLTLPDVGMDGQLRLRAASVLLVGAGGLGSPLGMYLAAAGVGRIGIVDFDVVDESNLQRQVLYGKDDVGQPKVLRARDRLAEINPHIQIDAHQTRLDATNALELMKPYDLVIDGTDNFPTRYLVNDACVLSGKTHVYGSIFRFEGQVSVFRHSAGEAPEGPCYRCLYPEPPDAGSVPNCAEGGVLGVLPGIIGTLQATEAIKLIVGIGDSLVGRLLLFDALEMQFRSLKLRRNPNCPVCGDQPSIHSLSMPEETCVPDQQTADNSGGGVPTINVRQLKSRLDEATSKPCVLLDVRTRDEWQICRLEGAVLIPLHELPERLGELNVDDDHLVYCRSGVRSAHAVQFMLEHGFAQASNVAGGILAWSAEIDPTVPRY